MSRELKFRAWDKTRKKMCESLLSIHWLYGNKLSEITADGSEGTYDRPSEEIILMQYTGLKDKNGVEIYEGDILSHLDFNKGIKITDLEYAFYLTSQGVDWNFTKVIGNIYQNPELLKGN